MAHSSSTIPVATPAPAPVVTPMLMKVVSPEPSKKADVKSPAVVQRLPEQFDSKLYPSGRLLTDTQIQHVFDELRGELPNRYSKEKFKKKYGINFGIVKDRVGAGQYAYYAVYNDGNERLIGKGAQAAIKLLQYLGDGLTISSEPGFFSLKTFSNTPVVEVITEHSVTSELKEAKGCVIMRDSKKSGRKFEFVLQYKRGKDLYQLRNTKNFGDDELLQIAIKILKKYKEKMIDQGRIHCDIKLENFMYDPDTGEVSIVDFSFSLKCKANEVIGWKNSRGTVGYRAPEVEDSCWFSQESDIYALGLLLEELLFNRVSGEDPKSERMGFDSLGRDTCYSKDSTIVEFLKKMRHPHSCGRPKFNEVLKFFTNKLHPIDEKSNSVSSASSTSMNDAKQPSYGTFSFSQSQASKVNSAEAKENKAVTLRISESFFARSMQRIGEFVGSEGERSRLDIHTRLAAFGMMKGSLG